MIVSTKERSTYQQIECPIPSFLTVAHVHMNDLNRTKNFVSLIFSLL